MTTSPPIDQGASFSGDDSDFSSEDEYTPEPEDLIQGSTSSFVERGPQDKRVARGDASQDKKTKENKLKDAPKEPAQSVRKTSQAPRQVNGSKYKQP